MPRSRFFPLLALLAALVLAGPPALAQPATRETARIASYGAWNVVRKDAQFIDVATGQRGTYKVCSAVLWARTASIEFEIKNEVAFGVYVGAADWSFRPRRGPLSLRSGGREIRIAEGMYAGPMVSGASQGFGAGATSTVTELERLAAARAPISVHDNRGRTMITFPNSGSDLQSALTRAKRC